MGCTVALRSIFFVVFLLPTLIFGQQSLSGAVFDKTSSNPLEGATIQLTQLTDSTRISARTNKGGTFTISNLRPGN